MIHDEPIWCLVSQVRGVEWRTWGKYADLRPALDAFFERTDNGTPSRRIVHGHCNTADHSPMYLCLDIAEVEAMRLYREA